MKTCRSCRWTFPVFDHEYRPVLMCWPNNDRQQERIAAKLCEAHERESGADEVEE